MLSAPDRTDDSDNTTQTEISSDDVSSDARTWGIIVHAAAFTGFIIPSGNILAPLLVWAIKKDESQFIDENGKQAVNFQITWTLLLIAAALSIAIGIGIVLFPLLLIAWFILVLIAIFRASGNNVYDYPLTIDVIS